MANATRNTKDEILDAASRLISVKGYHCTSLDDVLREGRVGKGNFYYYFKSKEELGYAILDRIVRAFVERTLEPSLGDQSRSPLERIYRLLDRVLESQRQCNCVGGCPMGNLASELSDVHEGFRQRLAEVFTLWRERVSRALGEAQARGELAARAEPRKVAQFIVAALEGAILMAKVTKEIDVMEQCVAELKAYLALNTVAQPASAYPHGVRG